MSVLEKTEKKEEIYFLPEVDILEREDAFLLVANIPGADDKSTEVTVEKNVLTIKADTAREEADGYSLYYSENNADGYRREFRLSESFNADGILASVKNGVLTVTLPKAEKALPRKIEVKS